MLHSTGLSRGKLDTDVKGDVCGRQCLVSVCEWQCALQVLFGAGSKPA